MYLGDCTGQTLLKYILRQWMEGNLVPRSSPVFDCVQYFKVIRGSEGNEASRRLYGRFILYLATSGHLSTTLIQTS